jgi:hypothetical protein
MTKTQPSASPCGFVRRCTIQAIAFLLLLLAGPTALAQVHGGSRPPEPAAPAAPVRSLDGWEVLTERWYELTLAGQPCGSIHALVERQGERIRSSKVMQMRLARGDTTVEVASETRFVESARGEPIEASLRQRMGATANSAPTETTVRFRRDGDAWVADIREGAEGQVVREKRLPGSGWLPPAALDRFVTERIRAGARQIEYRSVDVESGLELVTVTMRRKGSGMVNIDHEATPRTLPVSLWTAIDSLQKIEVTERYAGDGVLVESAAPLGIGELKTRLTSRERAVNASQRSGAEVLVASFVPAKRRIFGVMEKMRLAVRVETKTGEINEFPSVGAQRVRRLAPNALEIAIDAGRGSEPEPGDATNPAYLARSSLIDGSAPSVRRILDAALPKDRELPPAERAELLRKATDRALPSKNLASPFASAAEAAEARGGDCSEHAVLLAALLRESGIPARVASGLVYADRFAGERNVWAWHVWTQALLPEPDGSLRWRDLDATLPVPYHAAHICVAVGALEAGATDPMWTSTLSLIGNLSILDLTGEDAERAFEEGATPQPTAPQPTAPQP